MCNPIEPHVEDLGCFYAQAINVLTLFSESGDYWIAHWAGARQQTDALYYPIAYKPRTRF